MKALVYAALTLLLFTSEAATKNVTGNELDKQLIGRWKYTGQSGGSAGRTETAKHNMVSVIEFIKGGKYVRYTNGEPMFQGVYALCKAKSIYTGKIDNAIKFDPKVNSTETGNILTITGDTLLLADNINDGYTAGYLRID
ncbi:MAG: hypothetical protein WKF66_03605 [Pedobacter sp.]